MTAYYSDEHVTLHHGDARDVLALLPTASVDAIVTDPPYELGFMGKAWDGTGVAYDAAMWAECLRVLKPGGHLLAFGGTRTYHRMTVAIEDAGFEIRDSIHWIYGCLTADAEVLTEHGWKPGLEVEVGERVAQWDPASGSITLAPAQRVYRAQWDGPMRVLRNADTDQVLTPNHRVYHRSRRRAMADGIRRTWYDADWHVTEAASLSTWNPVQLPVAGIHDGPGIGGEDYAALLGWVWTEGGFDLGTSTGVRIYQSSVNADKVAEIAALMDRLGRHKRYDYERTYRNRTYTATTWFFTGDLAARVRADLPGKRPTYALLWRMTAAEKRALLRAAMLGDGSGWGGTSPQFFQKHEDDLNWLQTLLALIDQAGKVGMRGDRENGSVYLRNRNTTELQARHLRDSTEHYLGAVWCVQVPTGAFVARRNGKVFITGNSGFPKSLDVSKAIDKAAGAEREVVGTDHNYSAGRKGGFGSNFMDDEWTPPAKSTSGVITAPATPEAAAWSGWGTALKPAHEPIVVARKPLAGTVAGNVLAHGTGALNIDGCRVAGESTARVQRGTTKAWEGGAFSGEVATGSDSGRWPANVVLDEAAAAELDAQSGVSTKPSKGVRGRGGSTYAGGAGFANTLGEVGQEVGYGDTGGASRFFPVFRYEPKAPTAERPRVDGAAHATVKPLDLMRWLVRLVTPPGGTVLDPFAGSGTTAEACVVEGFRCVAIELDPAHLPLIKARLAKPIQPVLFGDEEAS